MNWLDSDLARRNTAVRKGLSVLFKSVRVLLRYFEIGMQKGPPIIVNSVPKSGTHLLMQLARSLPNVRYFGSFIAQQPSLTLEMRSQSKIDKLIQKMIPGEVVGAHLHFSEQTSLKIRQSGALHLLIIRDPAEIIMSESHYLAHMNPYHKISAEYKGLNSQQAINLTMSGSTRFPDLFPKFEDRVLPYLGWLDDDSTIVVRFEDVMSDDRIDGTLHRIVDAWRAKFNLTELCSDTIVSDLRAAIVPSKSHTFSGRKKEELHYLDKDQILIVERMSSLMGYRRV